MPVINQGELLGVLVIQCKENRQFTEQEETFLITLSAQIASIISVNKSEKKPALILITVNVTKVRQAQARLLLLRL